MATRWGASAAWGVGAAIAFVISPARAEEAAWPVRLAYDAHPGCPDALYFFYSAEQRSRRVRPALPGEIAATANVTIRQGNGQSRGTLEIAGPPVTSITRTVDATTCADVVQAMALLLALAFDPDANVAPPAPATPSQPPLPQPVVQRVVVRVPPERKDRAAAGIHGSLASGLGPSLRPLAGLFVVYQSLRDAVFRPRVEVSVLFSPDDGFQANGRRLTLGFQGARVLACPFGFVLAAGKVEVMPCVGFAGGRLVGEGDPGLPVQHTEARFWSSVTGGAALRWEVAEVLFLQLNAGAGLATTRAEFVLDGARAYRVDPLVTELALAAGVHFQ